MKARRSGLPNQVLRVEVRDGDPRRVANRLCQALAGVRGAGAVTPLFNELHARLLTSDGAARDAVSDTICSLMWPEVRRQLRAWSKARAEPDDVIHECADDSLLEYLKKPSRYDPHRGSPVAWLVAIGRNKVRDRWRRHARIQALEQPVGVAIERAVSASAQIEDDERERTRATSVELLRLYLSVAQTDEERRFLALHLTRARTRGGTGAARARGLPQRRGDGSRPRGRGSRAGVWHQGYAHVSLRHSCRRPDVSGPAPSIGRLVVRGILEDTRPDDPSCGGGVGASVS